MRAHSNGPSPAEPFNLGNELKLARDRKRWTQMQLALEARVSTRTIVALENRKATSPRADVIVRLARALGADPKAWLAQTGHSESDKTVERSLNLAAGLRFRGEMDPSEYFSRLLEELSNNGERLMCICYPSIPGTSHRPDVRNQFVKAVNRGLGVALVCPFQKPGPVENSAKPYLARYYRDVYEQVILLARDLSEGIDANLKNRLAVFIPFFEDGHSERWSMPPQGISKVRQALVKKFDVTEDESEFELIAWVELAEDGRDRMIEIYPSEKKDRMRVDVLRCWREYFAEIIGAFDRRKGWGSDARRRTGNWKIVYLR